MATFYFNGAVDGEWTELGNWWTDDTFTTQATALPTSSDSVIASATISSNSGSAPTLVDFTLNDPSMNYLMLTIAITVTGTATFNEYSSNNLGGAVTGNVTFNNDSYNVGTVTGNATFNDNSSNYINNGTITGNATFNGNSYNGNTVTGDATFNDSSFNLGTVGGTATYNGLTGVGPNTQFYDGSQTYFVGGELTTLNTNGTGYWDDEYYFNGTSFIPDAFYFTGDVDSDWATLGNWRVGNAGAGVYYQDSFPAAALPTSTDNVYASASVVGDGSTVTNFYMEESSYGSTSVFSGSLTVTGTATFAYVSVNEGTITGNAAFNYSPARNGDTGVITGNATFDNGTTNLGVVTGNATFSNYSRNGDRYGTAATQGYVGGNATFNDSCTQDSSQTLSFGVLDAAGVGGTATFNDSSRAVGGYCPTAIFNDSSSLGYPAEYDWSWGQVGTATFNDNSYVSAGALKSLADLGVYSCIGTAATFRDNARNNLGLLPSSYEPTPEVTLAYDKGINGSSILGVV